MTALSCLGPPTVFAAWSNKLSGLGPRLLASNISPVVIVGYETSHLPEMHRLLTLPRLRPLVFCGSFPPPGPVTQIQGPIAVDRLPLRDIGTFSGRKSNEAHSRPHSHDAGSLPHVSLRLRRRPLRRSRRGLQQRPRRRLPPF